ncbi:MAG: heme exporter protein CcmD [Gammaproteobacteria bacterium]|nr:MAG: heme exporter protein CcmD [Gammaproteobacteria bacterium]
MSIAEFFSMGGYAFFVWWSFGMTVFLMVGEVIMVARKRQVVIKRLKRLMRLDANQSASLASNTESHQISNSEA